MVSDTIVAAARFNEYMRAFQPPFPALAALFVEATAPISFTTVQ